MLLGAVERAYTPSTTLVDVFFPNIQVFSTAIVDMEFRKGSRLMAPFVVPGGKGINMARTGSTIRSYRAPLMRPKRIIEPADILIRGFGESEYSTKTPEQRAAEIRGRDLSELIDMCVRRQEWMAAQLLLNGEYDVEGLATMAVKHMWIRFLFLILPIKPRYRGRAHGITPRQILSLIWMKYPRKSVARQVWYRRWPSAPATSPSTSSTMKS
jgi:hypothetical protein